MGDPHLDSSTPISRKDDYREVTLKKLDSLLTMCINNSVDYVIFTGDMFEKFDQSIIYINQVVTALRRFWNNDIKLYSLIGNHDLPYNKMSYFNQTPLGLLVEVGVIKLLENDRPLNIDGVRIYGINFTEMEKVDNFKVDKKQDGIDILVMHYATDNTIPNESIVRERLGFFDIVVSGHDHHYYAPSGVRPLMLRMGSFTRRTKDDYNLTRKIVVYLYDTLTNNVSELPIINVDEARDVFKTSVMPTGALIAQHNIDFGSAFNKAFFMRKSQSIYSIVNSLPPEITEETKKVIIKHLLSLGIKEE